MDLELLNNLSDKEKEAVLEILNQYSNTGSSQRLNQLLLDDYKEIPVDIITFIKDPKYLGKAWHTSDGKCKLFPYWEEKLKQLFPDPYTTNYNTFIESGARGIGKSEIAITCGLYMMYRAMCLKNPLEYFNLKPTEKLAFAFMNITEALAYDIGVSKFQATVQMSPWFLERGTLSGRDEIIWNPPSYINLIVGSQPRHVIGQAVLYAFFDEISFIPNQDVDKQKQKAIDMIDTAIGGMKTRFLHEGRSPALLILASSKRSDKSFLEVHTRKKIETEGENLLLVDEPVWNIRPASDYSGRRFYVAQGNKYLSSEVLDLNVTEQDLKIFKLKGYKIISVPIEYKNNFQEDIDRALCDFAGVSSSDVTKYISGSRLQEIISKDYQNPFTKEVIEVGNGPEDFAQYSDFFDLTKVPENLKSKPLYIHLDMSLSGDKTGIAGTFIIGKKASLENSPKELYFQLGFGVAIKAPKGYQVSFAKNREFIYWLKQQGFNIKGITTDTYQNAALAQDLISKGYNYSVLSLDRVDNQSKICIPYAYFKNTIYEKRVKIYNCDLLIEEILGLERNETNGRIDHPDGGRIGCFTGNTKVRLVDGRSLTFLELIDEYNQGKTNWVYSFNYVKQCIEPKKILKAWCTLHDQPLLRVTLDSGDFVDCTLNHKFMLRDGSYKEAKDLQVNDSLMPLYTKYPSEGLVGYRLYYEPMENKWHYEHRRFAEQVLDQKYLVHHVNCNPRDNTPDNLIWMSRSEHIKLHSQMQTGAQSFDANQKRKASVKEFWDSGYKNTDDYIVRVAKLSQANLDKTPKELRDQAQYCKWLRYKNNLKHHLNSLMVQKEREEKIRQIEKLFDIECYDDLTIEQKNSYGVRYNRLSNPDIVKHISQEVSNNHAKGKYVNAYNALAACNENSKKLKILFPTVDQDIFESLFGFSLDTIQPNKRAPYYTKYRQKMYELTYNHKVKSIELLNQTEDVYDIEVEDNHNFALDCGVFVHNSKDICDAFAGSLYNASQHADEFNFEYGETLESIVDVSSQGMVSDQQLLKQQFEEELNNLFDPMSGFLKQQKEQQKKENPVNNNKMGIDFGMGIAKPLSSNQFYISNGIII